VAAMMQADPQVKVCPFCRGRGWKLVRARRAVVIGTLLRGLAVAGRRDCLDCGGTGHAD